ncbi:MAG TPA: 4-(cytidine 5'-diphospho)-2-C-methyl-D-erythritol kinase [Pyrinomonadaceae bacterium]|nr:4-(cytidine 5'-diphospho)-2-C-methyl-D-erythritol kinase [Pyrinomonadaceae bacterium]
MPVDSFTLPSFAKINLSLRVLGKRADNFHELCTIFQTVSLKDYLTFGAHEKIILTCDRREIPVDEKNLIVKAAQKLRERYKIERGASIHLEKNIPSPGGLGGGSSNAAVALLGLVRLWQIKFNFSEILEIGETLGSDVPFFLCGGTALGTARGNKITEMKDLPQERLLIVTPDVAVWTAKAFERLNAPRLTNISSKSILQICCNEADSFDLHQSNPVNDFENTICDLEPEIRIVRDRIVGLGAKKALLSGSGASVFGVFSKLEELQAAFDKLKKESNWRVFSAKTVSRREYRDSLNLEAGGHLKRF